MITYKTGNLLHARVEALVNAVNTVGVMGKGIALQFKESFPDNFAAYLEAVSSGAFHVGKVLVVPVKAVGMVKFVINFPTKAHWRFPSRIEWIEAGLKSLHEKIREHNILSIALPALGCGNGGLNWDQVRPLIEKELGDLDAEIIIYEPGEGTQRLLAQGEKPSASPLKDQLSNLASDRPSEWMANAQFRRQNRHWKKKAVGISQEILTAMKSRNLSQQELAERSGISTAEMTGILMGQMNLTLETISRLEISLQIAIINIPAPK
jgi:O-acetyl-ADP-ribose deacetylase (regulator of RNase III)/antitoxin component HigA of HigAB toxin-antitoxin module